MKSFKKHLEEACWDGYKQVGMKKKGNKMVPNCVPEDAQKNEAIPPEVAAAVVAAPMVAQGAKHIAKGAYKTAKGVFKARKAVKTAGQKLAKKVIK